MDVPVREDVRDNESRYRVDPEEYYLPDLDLSEAELEALHVAVTAIGLGGGGGEGAGALMKLGGLEGTGGMPVAELPLVDTLAPLFDASRRRAVVEFDYRGRPRRVEPWGLTSKFGRWYLVGQDLGVGEMRVFRADRIEGDVVAGEPGAFTVPDDFRADAYLADQPWEYGAGARDEGAGAHRRGPRAPSSPARSGPDTPIEREPDGAVVVELSVVNYDGLRSFVLGYLDHAEVLSPPEARADRHRPGSSRSRRSAGRRREPAARGGVRPPAGAGDGAVAREPQRRDRRPRSRQRFGITLDAARARPRR